MNQTTTPDAVAGTNGADSEFTALADRLFADLATQEQIVAAEAGVLPTGIWPALVEAGMPQVLVPAAAGGIGADVRDAAALLRMAGRHALPAPLLDAIVGNVAATRAGLPAADGLAGLLFLKADDLQANAVQARADPVLADVQFELPWPQQLERVVLVAPPAAPGGAARVALARIDATRAFAIAAARAGLEPVKDLHGEARLIVPAAALTITQHGLLPAGQDHEDLLRLASLLRGAQMLGALEWSAERSIAYAGERQQFGREIGRFQVVQQMLADMASNVVATTAIVAAAVKAVDHAGSGAGQDALLAAMRSRLGDAIDVAVTVAHQVHGAIGFTYEYGLNHRTRRLMAWRDEFGSVAFWRRRLAEHFAGLEANEVWFAMTALSLAAEH